MKEEYYYWPADLLVQYLVKDHHEHMLQMMKEVKTELRDLLTTYGVSYPLLHEVQRQYLQCAEALLSHLSKEAIAVLPYAKRYTQELKKQNGLRKTGFYSVCPFIDAMYTEHKSEKIHFDKLIDLMEHIDMKDNVLYQNVSLTLEEMRFCCQELIHLENDILFPKLVEMEATLNPIV
ncbi:hypothetical protein [Catalinimonas niigatensis]|uniref:hypothetical protein n=1 Tax=Catalinimonas niigatensis TaxID=1397264 RepID=UPI0026662440|nr:hypothetical protein [Catalinimonas niigatensis]WPP47983.1 hypothetical protein PZB72_14995 [Catalinimonas niigatensis]